MKSDYILSIDKIKAIETKAQKHINTNIWSWYDFRNRL